MSITITNLLARCHDALERKLQVCRSHVRFPLPLPRDNFGTLACGWSPPNPPASYEGPSPFLSFTCRLFFSSSGSLLSQVQDGSYTYTYPDGAAILDYAEGTLDLSAGLFYPVLPPLSASETIPCEDRSRMKHFGTRKVNSIGG